MLNPAALPVIRSALASLASSTCFVRSLPERSDQFSDELTGKDVVTFYWDTSGLLSGSFEIEATDDRLLSVRHVLKVDIRCWGMEREGGLLLLVRSCAARLHQLPIPGSHPLRFLDSSFEGYSTVSKRWVATLRFSCIELLGSEQPDPDEPYGPVVVRRMDYEQYDQDQVSIQSVFQVFPGRIPLDEALYQGISDWSYFSITDASDNALIRLPIMEVLHDSVSGGVNVEVRTDGVQAIGSGVPVFLGVYTASDERVFSLTVGQVATEVSSFDLYCPVVSQGDWLYYAAKLLFFVEEE